MKKLSLGLLMSLSFLFSACNVPAARFAPVKELQSTLNGPTQAPQSDGEALLALVNGQVIDGNGGEPLADGVVLIQGGRIKAVGPWAQIDIPSQAEVIDVRRGTILPGFINAHVHFAYNEKNLAAWASGGVTTVRDEGIVYKRTLADLLAWRDGVAKDPQYARLVSAGFMISVPGGYGELTVTSAQEARRKTIEEIEGGVEAVKISLEDGYAGRSGLAKLTPEEMAAVVQAAHERGIPVSGHITQAAYLRPMLDAGVDDIAHVPYDPIDPVELEEMVEKGIALVPTFTVFRNYGAPVQGCVDNLAAFVKLGGLVAMGNDYGGGIGSFELGIPYYEVEMMEKAGMTRMAILQAATSNAARVLRIEEKTGTLEAGKAADVLVVSGDPLQDLAVLKEIQLVVHNGVLLKK